MDNFLDLATFERSNYVFGVAIDLGILPSTLCNTGALSVLTVFTASRFTSATLWLLLTATSALFQRLAISHKLSMRRLQPGHPATFLCFEVVQHF